MFTYIKQRVYYKIKEELNTGTKNKITVVVRNRNSNSVNAFLVLLFWIMHVRSSRWRCSVRKGVPRNFAKFTGKQLCQSLFFIKKETLAQLFSCEFFEISKNTFLQNTSEQLLLTCMNVTVNANKHFNINTKNIYKFA